MLQGHLCQNIVHPLLVVNTRGAFAHAGHRFVLTFRLSEACPHKLDLRLAFGTLCLHCVCYKESFADTVLVGIFSSLHQEGYTLSHLSDKPEDVVLDL